MSARNFLSDKAQRLIPYVPGEQPRDGVYIKLNTNENPYPPSPRVIEAIREAAGEQLRLYPDPECGALRKVYADYLGLLPENIFVGNGSDEVLAIAFQSFYADKDLVQMPDISYSFYPVYCSLYHVKAKCISLKEDFSIDYNAYLEPNNGVVLANPNAPTSIALPLEAVEEIVKANPQSVVLIDEAYADFGTESAVELVSRYSNLLVVTTLSKSRSLAGLRVGFAVGSKELICGMETVKNSFNSYPVDLLAQKGAAAAISDRAYFEKTRKQIIQTREWTAAELTHMGFQVLPSSTNFLFVSPGRMEAKDLFLALRQHKILVRYFDKPRIHQYLRISIGTQEEMRQLIEAVQEIMVK